MKAVFLAVLFPFLFLGQAFAQNIRWDSTASTTNGAGTAVPILAMPGSSVAFFNACTTDPCSPTRATTYTSALSVNVCPSGAQVVWQLPFDQACTSFADSKGNFGAYFQPGAYLYTYSKNGLTYGPFAFNVADSGTSNTFINPEKLGTYFYADGFPSSCRVNGAAYTTQLDCAWYTALQQTATATANPTVVLGSANYTTCAGLPMILPGAMGAISVNLVSMGLSGSLNPGNFSQATPASITQTCSISTGTVSLPLIAGSAAKQITVEGVSIDANHLAPYAVQILGQNENSIFRQGQAMNGTTGPMVFGVVFNHPDGQTFGADLQDWLVVDNCGVVNGCGGGAAATVTLTAGVPSFAVTAPGSNLDSNTLATLIGYQNGTRNNPCSFMGVTTPVISGGHLTGVNTTATGCAGQVYISFTDIRAPQFGIDLENFSDSNASNLDIRTGAVAGLHANAGSSAFTAVHAWGQGLFGIQNVSFGTFVGTNCGETSLACFDNDSNFAKTIAVGTMYNSGTQYQGFSLFRNEFSTSVFKILGVQCQSFQTAEFHTLANLFDTVDGNTNGQNLWGNSLKDVEYCGSGTGETINATPGNAYVQGNFFVAGTPSMGPTLTFSLNSTPFVDCIATGFTLPPTISGSVITFPTNGFNNGGSVACTDFLGRVTTQSVPASGTPSAPQTFDLTSQFATSGATWVKLDPLFSSGTLFVNAPNGLVVQQGGITSASTTLIKSSVSLTNGAAAATGTLTNGPTAGNPTKWIPINDNGVTRYIPAW